MKTSKRGLSFIARHETPGGVPYLNAVKSPETCGTGIKYEIGFGHNSDNYFKVDADTAITTAKAYDLLRHDVAEAEFAVNKFIERFNLIVTQEQFDAMISAVYNGVPVYNQRTGICRAIVQYCDPAPNATDEAAPLIKEWNRWIYMTRNGKKVIANGLVKRRKNELRLFLDGLYDEP